MNNLGWTCPTCKTNWAPSVLKCDCGPVAMDGYLADTFGDKAAPSLATVALEHRIRQYGPGGTA